MVNKKIEEFLKPKDIECQEHLSKFILNGLEVKNPIDCESDRPKVYFTDLMNWSEKYFGYHLNTPINKFIHNRIIIDGQFLKFCNENSVKVECLYKDSVVSWKTESNFEKFFAQGIFKIQTSDGLTFIQNSLFHLGNQGEAEISFFIIVSNNNYEAYIKFRNQFDAWVHKRDRNNNTIRVIGGEDVHYEKDSSWDQLFFPETLKTEIKGLVENFLGSKDFYLNANIPWKRGMLLFGAPGNGKSSLIRTIISNYDFKPVTIAPGSEDDVVREAFSYAAEQSPALLFFEDLDSMLEKNDVSMFLNLMDGISTKNGILVIATANDVRRLKSNITDRPSRFDRKFEIGLPTKEMAFIYLKKWFGNLLSTKKAKDLAKYSEQNNFSYAYLKELYISSMFEALSNNRKVPTEKDIEVAINRLVKDKNILNNNVVNTDKYFGNKKVK